MRTVIDLRCPLLARSCGSIDSEAREPTGHTREGEMMRQKSGVAPAALDFGAILDRHQASLLGFLRGLVSDPELARDLLQDVFCDAWRATLREDAPFVAASADTDRRNWLFHTAYHRAISARRRAGVLRWESLDAGSVPLRERLEAPSR